MAKSSKQGGQPAPGVLLACLQEGEAPNEKIARLVRLYVQEGEVGRGRNKTALTKASQILLAVLKELRAAEGTLWGDTLG